MPFPAHGSAARRVFFHMYQFPSPSARRTRADAGIVLGKTPIDIERPPDIGSLATLSGAAEDVDEARHALAISSQQPFARRG